MGLFFVAGLAFGYSLGPPLMWLALAFPLAMAIGAAVDDGPSASAFVRLAVALAVTLLGVLLGRRLASEAATRRSAGLT